MPSGGNPDEIHALARRLRTWAAGIDDVDGRARAGGGVRMTRRVETGLPHTERNESST